MLRRLLVNPHSLAVWALLLLPQTLVLMETACDLVAFWGLTMWCDPQVAVPPKVSDNEGDLNNRECPVQRSLFDNCCVLPASLSPSLSLSRACGLLYRKDAHLVWCTHSDTHTYTNAVSTP